MLLCSRNLERSGSGCFESEEGGVFVGEGEREDGESEVGE